MMNGGGGPQGPGIMMDNPYGTLGPNGRLSLGRMTGYPEADGTLLPMGEKRRLAPCLHNETVSHSVEYFRESDQQQPSSDCVALWT